MLLRVLGWRHIPCLTQQAEPPPTRGVDRDSGTDSANGGWHWRLVRPQVEKLLQLFNMTRILNNAVAFLGARKTPLDACNHLWTSLVASILEAISKVAQLQEPGRLARPKSWSCGHSKTTH